VTSLRYGSTEFAHAEPFADALVTSAVFRSWVLKKTRFSEVADQARLLHKEMQAARSKDAATWWRSHFSEKCRCQGCSGQETDILAIFEGPAALRFALHFEVKQPADNFPPTKDQAQNYLLRAQCWIATPPKAILRHEQADTVLLCSASKLKVYAPHLTKFGAVITFEDVKKCHPAATAGTC
jgi:hypothetical protein